MLADSTLPAIRLCVYLHLRPSSGKWSLRLLLLLCCGILHFNIIAELYLVHANGDRVVSYLLGRASNTHRPPPPTPPHLHSTRNQWAPSRGVTQRCPGMEACNQKLVHIDQFRVINRIHIRHRSVLVEQALVINPSGTVEGFLLGGLIGDDDMCA